MEAVSARYAFPGFDEPRFKTPFKMTLTVPAQVSGYFNTSQTSERISKDQKWKTVSFAPTLPLPTYLIAIAVGPWDVVEAPPVPTNVIRKKPIPLRAIGPRGTAMQLDWILQQTPSIVKFYEEYTAPRIHSTSSICWAFQVFWALWKPLD